jgi:heavy metal sensor kinase
MVSFKIRTRVAVWYGGVIAAVLLLVAVAVSVVHRQIGLARVDRDLRSAMRTLDGVVVHELSEEPYLPDASRGALNQLQLPGIGLAVLDRSKRVLGVQASDVSPIPTALLQLERPGGRPRTVPQANMRIAASQWTHGREHYLVVVWTSLTPLQREQATLRNTMFLSVPIAVVAAMLGGWVIARRALRPLTSMAAAATAIDHHRLERRLPLSASRDELDQLAVAFNGVLDRLAGLVHTQRQFMADASHELRTPVSIARTAAQVTLGSSVRSEAEYRESLEIIADQMRRVTRMVDDMFLLALADLNARPLERRHFYLNEVVTDCVRAANVLATARSVAITARVGTTDIAATGDEGLVREMVMNLLDNAIRHTPSRTHVTVTVAEADGVVELAIEDSGPGIPPASQRRVFDRFVRLDTGAPGAGLGLSIAKWIAEQHGWQLHVDGRGQNSSRFVLTMRDAAAIAAT